MALTIFLDILGDEPLGYIGMSDELNIVIPPLLDVEDAIHDNQSTAIDIVILLGLLSAQHKVLSDTIIPVIQLDVESSIHKLYTHKDINAPVIFKCDSYLDTPKLSRVLDTPKLSRILDTPKISRILDTPYEC